MMVKICGITNSDDAQAAAEAGADALGFNFFPGSPRFIPPEAAAAIQAAPMRVGVFVDESPEMVAEIARQARLDVVQLHGSEDPGHYLPLRVWKAYRVTSAWPGLPDSARGAEAVLLDGPAPGTGESFDWSTVGELPLPVILAGGLGPDNIAEAIRQVRPWGVDACSRLEIRPGIKDHERMRRFISAARMVSI
jgi:phosphoribosylanthranilate isomerase